MTNLTPWIWDKKRPEQWIVDAEEQKYPHFFGSIYSCKAHSSHKSANFEVLHGKDVIQCLAITTHKELVLVSQFRPGNKDLTLEIPGGCIETGEEPLHALHRELREESGYTGTNPTLLFSGLFNPALMTSRFYCYLLLSCEKTCDTDFDPTEDCATYLLPLKQLDATFAHGTFQSAVTAFGLSLLQNWLHQHPEMIA